MQLQEISLIMSSQDMAKPAKGTKVSDATFDSFMTNHGLKVSEEASTAENVNLQKQDARNPQDNFDSVKKDSAPKTEDKLSTSMGNSPKVIVAEECDNIIVIDNVDLQKMIAQTMTVLQNMFGLSEQELVDVMEQLGIQIQDLLFQIQQDVIVPVNTSAIQQFVLGLHGVEDTTSILTNDVLSQEIANVSKELTLVIADCFELAPEEVPDLQEDLQLSFAEQMQQVKISSGESSKEELVLSTEEETMGTTTGNGETMQVIVEKDTSSGNGGDSDFFKNEGTSQATMSRPENYVVEQTVSNFTERMSEALEKVSNAEELVTQRTSTEIVEQVIRQVRVRVMPETTSMELQLNPASLGRVNLMVATTGGVATATMVVENQMAKSALESQMITLKETFAEQGLKVDEVEVTVGEFGLKKENQQQQEEARDKKSNRRFRGEDELTGEDVGLDDNVTSSDRRDVNSVVDYTA